jgi:hypothetical protein
MSPVTAELPSQAGDNPVDDLAPSRATAVDDDHVIHCRTRAVHQPVETCGHHKDEQTAPEQPRRAVVHDPQPLLLRLLEDLFSVGTSESELV